MRAHERIAQCPATDPPSAAQEHRVQARKDVPHNAAEPVSARQRPQTEVLAGPLGGEALPERGRVELLVPLPRPLPSSGAVRCGVWTRQGKWRRSSVHAATWNERRRSLRRRALPVPPACFAFYIHCQPLGQTNGLHNRQRNLFEPGGGGGADGAITAMSLAISLHARN